jgi:ligand-binding SRPBCC domain-containing protein
MRVKKKEWKQFVPRPLDEIWQFFSRPENLNAMTPDGVKFEILSDIAGVDMYEGMVILYKIQPLAFAPPMNWMTEITHIHPKKYFVDDQRFGPYALWHHEHHFEEVPEGVMMTDLLHYKVPFGPIGSLANALFVESKVDEIFSYRKQAVEQLFSFRTEDYPQYV